MERPVFDEPGQRAYILLGIGAMLWTHIFTFVIMENHEIFECGARYALKMKQNKTEQNPNHFLLLNSIPQCRHTIVYLTMYLERDVLIIPSLYLLQIKPL